MLGTEDELAGAPVIGSDVLTRGGLTEEIASVVELSDCIVVPSCPVTDPVDVDDGEEVVVICPIVLPRIETVVDCPSVKVERDDGEILLESVVT